MKKIKFIPLLSLLTILSSCNFTIGPAPSSSEDTTLSTSVSDSETTTTTTTSTSENETTTTSTLSNPTTSLDTSTTTGTSEESISISIKDPTTPSVSIDDGLDIDHEEEKCIQEFNSMYELKDFFDINNKINIEIEMDKKQLFQLSEDFDAYPHHSSPIYRVCNVKISINDDSIYLKNVGIRLKGNTSRRKFADENGNIYALVHFKLNFAKVLDDVTYKSKDEEARIDDRNILGLKKLDIKWNKNYDSTHIKEYVAHELYKEFNVIDTNVGFSQVSINGSNMGLYLTYENIDKQFLKKRMDKANQKGDLYKMTYTASGPADFTNGEVGRNIGVEDEDANNRNGFFPAYDLKTNEDESTHENLLNVINVLNNAKTFEEIDKYVNLNQFIEYEAVSYVIGDPDDLRNNYNNTYGYFPSDNRLIFIPYDKDRVFGITKDWDPNGSGMTTNGPFSDNACGAGKQQNPLYLKTLINPLNGDTTYKDMLVSKIENIFANSKILKSFDKIFQIVKHNYEDIIDCVTGEDVGFSLEDNINWEFADFISAKEKTFEDKKNR